MASDFELRPKASSSGCPRFVTLPQPATSADLETATQTPVQHFELESPGARPPEFSEVAQNLGAGSKAARSTVPGTESVQLPGGYSLAIEVRESPEACTLEVSTHLRHATSGLDTMLYEAAFGFACGE